MSDIPICECGAFLDQHHDECPVLREIERLRAELAECRNATAEDALRYAFIRAKHAADDDRWYVCGVDEADGDILDAKIDEARKGEGEA